MKTQVQMMNDMTPSDIRYKLFEMQDVGYREFSSSLMPTVDKRKIIGVRIPMIRKFAKELVKSGNTLNFLNDMPHLYFEENNLHAFIIEAFKDEIECTKELDKFLPYVDNWATCDSIRPKCFKNNPEFIKRKALEWTDDSRTYVKRFGIGVLMNYFLDENFSDDILETVSKIDSDEYYVNMMCGWFFATALAKQHEKTLPYITEFKLFPIVHRITINKAVESFRITQAQKDLLKKYRI